ncbi:MAG: hypothetical protein HUK02_03350, partial [Bacteroidaceae bacterium]|nr:hypothetical protein [Bacteroidaceae bacterium]
MKKYAIQLTALVVAGAFTSCSDDTIAPDNGDTTLKGIQFNVIKDGTRTHYNGRLDINWDKDDEIWIGCDATYDDAAMSNKNDKGKYAIDKTASQGTTDLTDCAFIKDLETPLYWGAGEHQFYAGTTGNNNYGNKCITNNYGVKVADNIGELKFKDTKTGVVQCRYDCEQYLLPAGKPYQQVVNGTTTTLNDPTTGSKIDLENLTDAQELMCSMDQNYMVSAKKTAPVANVDLHFKTIMTT